MRSARWYGDDRTDFEGKPVVGAVNPWGESNPCHTHLRVPEAEPAARRSVWVPPVLPALRGYVQPFPRRATPADRGFLEGVGGVGGVGEPAIH